MQPYVVCGYLLCFRQDKSRMAKNKNNSLFWKVIFFFRNA
ncbi:hypothetical protein EPYR_03520 [Erwinia pyrifoliae DSM 12163]|nr:hypothetical protein EPYR_03520 [Erwinia pyrifoliae DSM 12163]